MNYRICQSLLIIISLCYGLNAFCQGKVTRPTQLQSQTRSPQKAIPKVTVNEPDGFINGHGYVDLGLPSGTKWATCNIGAKRPEQIGNYYSWGELKPKSDYNRDSYKLDHWEKDITGMSAYDVATATFGKGYVIPNKSDFEELINNCKKTYTEVNGVKGTLFVGLNGNSIFLPLTGRKFSAVQDDIIGFYWTSTTTKITDKRYTKPMSKDSSDQPVPKTNGAYLFSHRDAGTYLYETDRYQGNCIRPVKKN